MTGVCNSPRRNKADDIAEAISTGSCHFVLETSPPDYVQTISRYLESSVPQLGYDAAPNEATESDSGDSMFITQKPVPEPVRTRKRHHKPPASPKELEESEDDALFCASPQESTTSNRRKKTKKLTLPKYIFPFVKEKQCVGRRKFLTGQQNTSLHNATMGGFFKCVRELWQGYKGVYMDVSLPTVDMDEDFISPLSEEEERSEEEDIKVVEKSFLVASKTKCSQPWYNPGNTESRRRRASNASHASHDVSRKDRKKVTDEGSTSRSVTTATLLLSDTESLDGGYACRELPRRETGDKRKRHHTSIPETPKTKRLTGEKKKILFQKSEREEELCCDSDATVCDPLQASPREHTQGGKEAITPLAEAQADVFQMDDLNQTGEEEEETESQSLLPQFVGDTQNDGVCAESTLKKKKKAKRDHGSGEGGRGHSQEDPRELNAAASVNVEAEETFILSDQNRANRPAMQTCDELERSMKTSAQDDTIVRQEKRDSPDSAHNRKRKRSKASVMCNIENVEQKKKEKKGVELILSQSTEAAAAVNVNDDPDQKKNKKEQVITDKREEDGLENIEFSLKKLGSSCKKKKRKHKSMKQSSSLDEAQLSNDGATVEEAVVKQKKRESISDGGCVSYAPDKSDRVECVDSQTSVNGSKDNDAEMLTKKKKKKKKRREKMDEICNTQASGDTVALRDEVVSVWNEGKERTSSFLQADSEEKSSKSVAAGVCDAEADSAEIAGNSGDGVSKKKKKKKKKKRKKLATQVNVEDHGGCSAEANKTCGGVLTETVIKRKKKHKKSKSESVAFMDRLHGAADQGPSPSDEDTMQRKKKKRCKEAM